MALVNGGTSVKFNTTEIQTAKRIVESIQWYGGLQKDMSFFRLARANASRKTNNVYPARIIPCTGYITGTSVSDLKTEVDAFHTLLDIPSGDSANLDIDVDQAGNYRRWVADPQQINIENTDSLLAVKFSFEFYCTDPFGRNTSTSTLINATVVTTSGGTTAMTPVGTAPQQLPTITCTLNSFTTAAAPNSLTISNPATTQALIITRTWTAADVLVIDLYNQTIKVNGTAVDYQGPLTGMSWKPAVGSIGLSDDFTARNITLNVTNVNRYK